MEYNRVHAYTVWEKISRFSFLLLIPLTEPLLSRPQSIPQILGRMGLNVLAFVILLLWAAGETKATGYRMTAQRIEYKNGFLLRRQGALPIKAVCSITLRETVIPALFGAAHFYADTPAGRKNHADISLTLSRKGLREKIKEQFYYSDTSAVYEAKTWRIFIMAMSWSNPAAGLLLIAPFINRAGKILGEEINARLYNTVDKALRLAAWGIPPAAEVLGNLLVAGWAAAMLAQIFRYGNFKVSVSRDLLLLERGVLARSHQILQREGISALSVRQTLVMRLLGVSCCYLHTAQAGKHKGDRSLLFAANKRSLLEKQVHELFSFPVTRGHTLTPPKRALRSYIGQPILQMVLFIVVFLISPLFGQYSRVFPLILTFVSAVLMWWLTVRVLAHKTSGMSLKGGILLVSGYRKLTLLTMAIPLSMVQLLEVRQNPFQKRYGRCSVRVFLFSESKEYFTVQELDYRQVIEWQEQALHP